MINAGRISLARNLTRNLTPSFGLSAGRRLFNESASSDKKDSDSDSGEQVDKKKQILRKGLELVPEHGFDAALTIALREYGYSDASRNLFANGAYDLIQHHLDTQKDSLHSVALLEHASFLDNTKTLTLRRLMSNRVLGAPDRISEALSIMTLPSNITASISSLHDLSDEIAWLAGDNSTDFTWYTRRAAISTLYASCELFQSQDNSHSYRDTAQFLEDRLSEMDKLHYASDSMVEWIKFNAIASINVLKSLTRG